MLVAAPAQAVDVTTNANMGAGSLRQAVIDTPEGGTITIQPLPGPIVLSGGEILIDKDLTIVGQGMATTTVDANNTSRIFRIDAAALPEPTVTIADLKLTRGNAPGGVPPASNGGAINALGTLSMRRVAITDSRGGTGMVGIAGGNGGGVYSAGPLNVSDSLISGNFAGSGGPGAPGMGGPGGNGGGLALGAQADVTRSTISGNFAGGGGPSGIADPGGAGGRGGGIDSPADGLFLDSSTVTANEAGDPGPGGPAPAAGANGGGVWGSYTIINSTIAGNSAGDGGVLGSGGSGGGLFGFGSIVSTTITGNIAGSGVIIDGVGAGLFGSPVASSVRNSILSDNVGADCGGMITDGLHNLGPDPSCPPGFSDAPAALGPLQGNGGSTTTIALLPGSGAIDLVPSSACTGAGVAPQPLTADQRGLPRPSGAACDAGAFEVQMPPLPPGPAASLPAPASTSSAKKCPKGKKLKKKGKKRKCVRKKKKRKK